MPQGDVTERAEFHDLIIVIRKLVNLLISDFLIVLFHLFKHISRRRRHQINFTRVDTSQLLFRDYPWLHILLILKGRLSPCWKKSNSVFL